MRRHGINSFDELMRRSTEDVAWFTDAILQYLDIQFYKPYTRVMDLSGGIQFPRWCVDGEMNIVHNLLDKRVAPQLPGSAGFNSGKTALQWEGEEGDTRSLSYLELYRQTNRAANALRSLGIGKGDAVGLFMPMTPEIVIALLAIAKIGAVILPLFSGYGEGAIVSRLVDADAKALFTADGAWRHGKAVEMKAIADEAAAQVPTLKHMIV